MLDAALAAEFEPHAAFAFDLDVPGAQRRQSKRFVIAGVRFVADAYEGRLEHPDDGREHFVARHIGL